MPVDWHVELVSRISSSSSTIVTSWTRSNRSNVNVKCMIYGFPRESMRVQSIRLQVILDTFTLSIRSTISARTLKFQWKHRWWHIEWSLSLSLSLSLFFIVRVSFTTIVLKNSSYEKRCIIQVLLSNLK